MAPSRAEVFCRFSLWQVGSGASVFPPSAGLGPCPSTLRFFLFPCLFRVRPLRARCVAKLRRLVAADRWFGNPDRCRFRGSGVPGECELEHGGDGDVDADAPCQRQLQAGQDHVRALRGRASPDRSPDESCEDHFSHMFDNDGEGARSVISGSKAVRDAILAGKKRRNNLKKGIIRRFVGHTRAVLASVCLATAAYAGATLAGVTASTLAPRPDCMEVFGGHTEVSFSFSRWGWTTCQPIDLVYGSDLNCQDERKSVLDFIRTHRPRLVIVSYPRKLWSPINNISAVTSQDKRRVEKKRRKELPFLELTEDIFNLQLSLGGDALGENPLPSESFKKPPIQRILTHPQVFAGVGHGCRFNIRHKRSGKLLKKPTLWFSTAPEICDELSLRCQNETCKGDHEHDVCMGGKKTSMNMQAGTPGKLRKPSIEVLSEF